MQSSSGYATIKSETASNARETEESLRVLSDGIVDFSVTQVSNAKTSGFGRFTRQGGQRKLQDYESTEMVIKNNCRAGVYFAVVFRTIHGWQYHRWYYIDFKDSISFRGVVDTTAYIYGVSPTYVWDGDSDFCLNGDQQCFQEINLGTVQPEQVFHYLTCSSRPIVDLDTPAPTAAPVTPAPTAAPVPTARPSVNFRNLNWLFSHNRRRKGLFEENGMSPKDLMWSNSLAAASKAWAEQLVGEGCSAIRHDTNRHGGENIAMNIGSASRTPNEVMTAWFEEEESLGLGRNGHYTQVGWRATDYVGCGEAQTELPRGSKCFVQVCRYVRPGNCNVWLDDGVSWYQKMLSETSPCGPLCPEEGCP